MKRKSSKHHHQYLTDIGTGGRQKYATRHLAALDFLQSISMQNEFLIKEAGSSMRDKVENFDTKEEKVLDEDMHPQQRISTISSEDVSNIAGGKKLDGRLAPIVAYPLQFRYRMKRYHEQSAVVKKWEGAALLLAPSATTSLTTPSRDVSDESEHPTMLNSRTFFSRSCGYPMCLSTVVAYAPEVEKARLERQAEYSLGSKVYKLPQRDWRGTSFRKYFQVHAQDGESGSEDGGDNDSKSTVERKYLHDPDILDDPEMIQGKHRHVMKGDAFTGPVMSSVILYVNAKDLKDDLNSEFRESHPQLPQSLTLSKIRNLKKVALLGCLALDIEMSTIAIAFICFEHLCLKGVVTKTNRRLSMAVCLVLAIKYNEPLSLESQDALLEFADRQWSIPKREVIEAEFGAFMQLDFNLHIPHEHIHVMYTRLLKQMHKSSKTYLGEERHLDYTQCLKDLVRQGEKDRNRDDDGSRGSSVKSIGSASVDRQDN